MSDKCSSVNFLGDSIVTRSYEIKYGLYRYVMVAKLGEELDKPEEQCHELVQECPQ